ncbi:MAG TPA: cytochrome P450, partial [Solirubrobacteraceae bacterium]|nr:cytochrome P450 [Solirubrobacteraceae bacterium]
ERFIEADGGSPPGTYTWIPFGGGVRRCLGGAFAQFEMEAVLRQLVLRRTLAPARASSERVYRRTITETPRHDAEVVLGRAARAAAGTGASTGHTAVAGAGVSVAAEGAAA